jgi:murein tripeptide amidase MpaA
MVWFIGRQHPGETMAEWWMQGLLARLTDPTDALAVKLRALATFHLIPNMNPDGSVKGLCLSHPPRGFTSYMHTCTQH